MKLYAVNGTIVQMTVNRSQQYPDQGVISHVIKSYNTMSYAIVIHNTLQNFCLLLKQLLETNAIMTDHYDGCDVQIPG